MEPLSSPSFDWTRPTLVRYQYRVEQSAGAGSL